MASWHQRLIAATAATSLVLIGSVPSAAVSLSETAEAVLIPGATVFKRINPLYPVTAATYPDIGIHFRQDDDPQVVQYSQNALKSNKAIQDGVRQALLAVESQPAGKVVVIGESMGSMVAWRVAQEVAKDDPSHSKDISFVLIAPPEAGVAEYFPEGTYIPILNYRIARIPAEMPYPTTIVIGEYDGWSDPPDRPWNLLASANALLGIAFVHGPPIFTTDPADVPPENISRSPDGKVTTMLVPTEDLPLTQPLRLIGVPDEIVDQADQVLRPLIDLGYSRHDQPGDQRPYLSDGKIQRNVQSQQLARQSMEQRLAERRGERLGQLARPLGERRAERRQERLGQLTERREGTRDAVEKARDKLKRSVHQLTDRVEGAAS